MLTGCACQVLVASVFSRSCAKSSNLQAPKLVGQHMCSTVPKPAQALATMQHHCTVAMLSRCFPHAYTPPATARGPMALALRPVQNLSFFLSTPLHSVVSMQALPALAQQPGVTSPEAPIHTQQDHGCHLQALPRAGAVAVVHQIAQLVVGEVLAVQQIPVGASAVLRTMSPVRSHAGEEHAAGAPCWGCRPCNTRCLQLHLRT
jgi:hypothetical protein